MRSDVVSSWGLNGGEQMTQSRLPADADAGALARFVTTIMQGMAVQAAGGTTRAQLRKIAEMALRTWPPPSLASG